MLQRNTTMLIELLKTLDMIILFAALFISASLTDMRETEITLRQFFEMKTSVLNVILIFGFFLAWHMILFIHKLYVSRRLSTFSDEVVDIIMATSTGTLMLLLFSRIFHIAIVNTLFVMVFWANVNLLTIPARLTLRCGLRQLRMKGMNLRNIVIAGIHGRALLFAREIVSRPELGYRLLGFIDDAGETFPEFENSGYQQVASIENFNEFLRGQVVDEVAICLPIKSHYQQAARIAAICEEHGIVVRFLSDIFNPKIARAMTQQFEGHSIITFYTGNMQGGGVIVKRGLDFIVSLLLVVLLFPLMLLAALMVKATSDGPVFFVQKRLGLNKHHFNAYKFRTMYPDAEQRQAELEHLNEVQGAAFKIKNDPRITPIGRILRKTSIDELPQLFNVLKGEMSLVGPRPLPIRDYEGFDKDWHRRRFSVRPGITCLWQISGRSNVSFDEWMNLDMKYIDNWSLWLDLKILLGTIPAVLKGDGAE